MSIQITLSDSLAKSLWKHAIPFVETDPVSIIEGWARYFEEHPRLPGNNGALTSIGTPPISGEKVFNPMQPPDLFHTRVRGLFGTSAFNKWNDLLRIAHIEAFKKAKSFDELKTATHAQVRNGPHSDSGYHYVPEIGISLQGVDANHAWQHALRLAQYLRCPIHASIEWRHNDKAAYPGETGILRWNP